MRMRRRQLPVVGRRRRSRSSSGSSPPPVALGSCPLGWRGTRTMSGRRRTGDDPKVLRRGKDTRMKVQRVK